MIRSDLRTYLLTRTGLTDLITADGRVHLHLSRTPQTTPPLAAFPTVIYRRASGGYGHDLDGSDGNADPNFDFHVMDPDPDVVEAICEQLRLALQGFPKSNMGSTHIESITLDDEQDDYLESTIGDDVGFHRTVLTFSINHTVAIPTFA